MRVDFASNIRAVERGLSDVAKRQIPFATSLALNETAKAMVDKNKDHMAEVFDRPTRWTLNAFHFRRATKSDLSVKIERKDAPRGRHFLEVQAAGGARPKGGWEKQLGQKLVFGGVVGHIVPTKHMKRDGHGNIARGEMQRVLSGVGASSLAGSNTTKDTRAKKATVYFVPKHGSKARPGVYKRAAGKRTIERVLAFDVRPPNYSARFKFEEVMARVAADHFPGAFERALIRALSTARP